jgi:hypothetical protein
LLAGAGAGDAIPGVAGTAVSCLHLLRLRPRPQLLLQSRTPRRPKATTASWARRTGSEGIGGEHLGDCLLGTSSCAGYRQGHCGGKGSAWDLAAMPHRSGLLARLCEVSLVGWDWFPGHVFWIWTDGTLCCYVVLEHGCCWLRAKAFWLDIG